MKRRRFRYKNRISSFTFDSVGKVRRPRWTFPLNHTRTLTMNVGTLYPIDVQEAYPGDEFIDNDNFVATLLSSYVKPNMGNMYLDYHVFFVPLRQVFDDFKEVFGQAKPSQYTSPVYAEIPTLSDLTGSANVVTDSVFDHLYALPPVPISDLSKCKVSILPARAFAHIYNEWYRDENNVDEVVVQTGNITNGEKPNSMPWSANNYTGMLPKVRKLHDYFTSCLPAPQKGSAVALGGVGGRAPVYAVEGVSNYGMYNGPIKAVDEIGSVASGVITADSDGTIMNGGITGDPSSPLYFDNLVADLSGTTLPDINDLRLSFASQRILERDARVGSRFTEYVQGAFGVTPPDLNIQRPEYIAGFRAPITAHVVPQTSAGTEDSPLGALAAYGNSSGKGRWHKAVREHGYFITCVSIRQMHVYQQGCEKFLTRKKRFDFLDPEFVHLGEQPVKKGEIFFTGTDADEETFGFNEIYADMRYRPSTVTGQARSGAKLPGGANADIDRWHLGDNYSNAPTLNEQFIEETPVYLDRCISVPSESQDQFIVQFFFQRQAIRPLPARGTPGRIDHTYGG